MTVIYIYIYREREREREREENEYSELIDDIVSVSVRAYRPE